LPASFFVYNLLNKNSIASEGVKASMGNNWLIRHFAAIAISAGAIPVWAGDYQEGLTAYIDGNYALAQKHWLRGAQEKDAKSMFNLGLLHEQAKVNGANNEKAMNWFSLANDNGYSAAAYHMAQRMLDRGGSDDEAISLIRTSAAKGYAPARRYLGLRSDAGLVAEISSEVPVTRNEPGVSTVPADDLAWISRQPSKNWTIQLLAFTDKGKVDSFVREHNLSDRARYYSEAVNGEVFYKLVYGSYASKDKADFARQNLNSDLSEHGPWLRQWSSVHKALK